MLFLLSFLTACGEKEVENLPVYQTIDDLKGKKIGAITGCFQEALIEKEYPEVIFGCSTIKFKDGAFDKEDIVTIAKKIDTYETSILPYEDCCTVFLPKHPTTKPRLEKILESESKLDCEALIEAAVASAEVINIRVE